MYTHDDFIEDVKKVFAETDGNLVDIPDIGKTTLYDEPLVGFAAAEDEIFGTFKRNEAIGPNFLTPVEWLPSAKTVISIFFPSSDAVRTSNRVDKTDPSPEWQYARKEGQEYISRCMAALKKKLEEKGIEACVPGMEERFYLKFEKTEDDFHVDSSWSERHAAFACGLGTFGISRGIISERGMAGRYGSLIVSAEWPVTGRRYTEIYEYCIKCGACVSNCPVNAISLEYGKNNVLCNSHVEKMKEKYAPRYGCGKCQVGVPCENRIPV